MKHFSLKIIMLSLSIRSSVKTWAVTIDGLLKIQKDVFSIGDQTRRKHSATNYNHLNHIYYYILLFRTSWLAFWTYFVMWKYDYNLIVNWILSSKRCRIFFWNIYKTMVLVWSMASAALNLFTIHKVKSEYRQHSLCDN